MKKIIICFTLILGLTGCAELQQVVNNLPQAGPVSDLDISNGLRAALDKGIEQEVSKLMQTDGFYRNELVKILLPEELQKVDSGLRKLGLDNVADEGLKLLNRAAEDATKEALPIFVNAVKDISFTDAREILLGEDDAATSYLRNSTRQQLYAKFKPVIDNNLSKVGATTLWTDAINRYNSLPLVTDVNPDLTDYVTDQALQGVFRMIEKEEVQIRNNLSARTSELLRRVFSLQDK